MKKILLIICMAGIILSCEPGKKEEKTVNNVVEAETGHSLKVDLLGEWRNLALKVKVKGSDSTIDVTADQWEDVLQIKPIRTTFREDDTYVSEYRGLDGEVFMTREGIWSVKGDSLIMGEDQGSLTSYAVTISGNTAEFAGYVDWNEDGQADDYYWGKQEKH